MRHGTFQAPTNCPDPSLTYKIVFSAAQAAAKPGEVNPTLQAVARYVNTLAKNGVGADHRKIAVVFHHGWQRCRHEQRMVQDALQRSGQSEHQLLQSLKNAGVDFRVCGQALLGKKIDPTSVLPEIQVDLWALTTMMNLPTRGYVRAGA